MCHTGGTSRRVAQQDTLSTLRRLPRSDRVSVGGAEGIRTRGLLIAKASKGQATTGDVLNARRWSAWGASRRSAREHNWGTSRDCAPADDALRFGTDLQTAVCRPPTSDFAAHQSSSPRIRHRISTATGVRRRQLDTITPNAVRDLAEFGGPQVGHTSSRGAGTPSGRRRLQTGAVARDVAQRRRFGR